MSNASVLEFCNKLVIVKFKLVPSPFPSTSTNHMNNQKNNNTKGFLSNLTSIIRGKRDKVKGKTLQGTMMQKLKQNCFHTMPIFFCLLSSEANHKKHTMINYKQDTSKNLKQHISTEQNVVTMKQFQPMQKNISSTKTKQNTQNFP